MADGKALPRLLKALVVDDDPAARRLMERWLQSLGAVETIAADNGLEGLEAVLGERPDLVVIDLRMPVVDGLQLLELIRTNPSCDRTPALLVSAYGEEQDLARAISIGIWDYIEKPLDAERTRKRFERAVRAVREQWVNDDGEAPDIVGSRVLVVDPDPGFRRFAAQALQPPLLVETAATAVQGAAAALTRRPALALAHESFYPLLRQAFARAGKAPRTLRLVGRPDEVGADALLRSYNGSILLAQVSRALAEVAGRPVGTAPVERSMSAVADRALERFFAALIGEPPEPDADAETALDVERACWVDLRRAGGPLRMRFTIEAGEGFTEALVRGLLPDRDGAPIPATDRDSALAEAAALVGARLRGLAFERRLLLTADPPRLAAGRLPPLDGALHRWERTRRWRGRWFRTRGEIFDETTGGGASLQ